MTSLVELHKHIQKGSFLAAQDILRGLITKRGYPESMLNVYIQKSYEVARGSEQAYRGLTESQLDAHLLLVRQLLIENSEEFDRRVSRLR